MALEDAVLRAIDDGGYDLDGGEGIDITPEMKAMADACGIEPVKFERTFQQVIVDRNETAFGTAIDIAATSGSFW